MPNDWPCGDDSVACVVVIWNSQSGLGLWGRSLTMSRSSWGRVSLGLPARQSQPPPCRAETHGPQRNNRCRGRGGEMVSSFFIAIPSHFLYCSLQSIKCNFLASPKLERPDQKYRVSQLCGPRSDWTLTTALADDSLHLRPGSALGASSLWDWLYCSPCPAVVKTFP